MVGRRRPLVLDLLKTLGVILWSVTLFSVVGVLRRWDGNPRRSLAMAHHTWAPWILKMTEFEVDLEQESDIDWSRPYFVASNHQSFLDIPVLFYIVPSNLHFVVKKELGRVPFLAGYIRNMGMVFVDRRDRESSIRSIGNAAQMAADGHTILLFPEGTRSRDGELGVLKTGMLAAAIESGTPVLPVTLVGTGEGMAPGWIPRYRPGQVYARFGSPLPTDHLKIEDRSLLAEQLRDELLRLRSEIHASQVDPPSGNHSPGSTTRRFTAR